MTTLKLRHVALFCFWLWLIPTLAYTATAVTGELLVKVKNKQIHAALHYHYVADWDSVQTLSLFLTQEVTIEALKGNDVQSFSFDTTAQPFATVRITLKRPLNKGEVTDFSISYGGTLSKGFWTDDYGWIDLDPDFMILPLFTDLHHFTYRLTVSSDDQSYMFYDLTKPGKATTLEIRSPVASYYFHSVVAGKTARLHQLRRGRYLINIVADKPDSVVANIGHVSAEILHYFNTTFGRKDTINSCMVLFRPLPDSVHRVIRSKDRSIVFSSDHQRIKTLAHEIAHFWWNRGNALTTEKWLQESFAEYASFMFIRHQQGQEEFEKLIAQTATMAKKAPALLGSSRFSAAGNDLIYFKGPYLLYQLEEEIGRNRFVDWLMNLNHNKTATTKDLLTELQQITSVHTREAFENRLNR